MGNHGRGEPLLTSLGEYGVRRRGALDHKGGQTNRRHCRSTASRLEPAARFERSITTIRKLSGLPTRKTLGSFDFAAQPDIPKPTVEELATLRFLHQGENVLLLGPCGVGKTHLATGLALTALARGHRVYFLTLHDLVTKSRAARDDGAPRPGLRLNGGGPTRTS